MESSIAVSLINTKLLQFNAPLICADLGAGDGIFTYALSTLLVKGSQILAVDRNMMTLSKVKTIPSIKLQTICADFINEQLPLNNLDLLMMANSLHFVKEKRNFVRNIEKYMKPGASVLLVEYDLIKPSYWVPYPLRADDYKKIFGESGYKKFEIINRVPSRFGKADIVGMYIAQ